MVWILLMLFFAHVQGNAFVSETSCLQTDFDRDYKTQPQKLNITLIGQSCGRYFPECNRDAIHVHLTFDLEIKTYIPHFTLRFEKVEEGCWGFFVQLFEYNERKMSRYIKYEKGKIYPVITYAYKFSTQYRFIITPLPNGLPILIDIDRTPSKCEVDGIQFLTPDIQKTFSHCLYEPDIQQKQNAVSPLCHFFSNKTIDVIRYLQKTQVKEVKCQILPFVLPSSNENHNNNQFNNGSNKYLSNTSESKHVPTIIGISAVALLLVLIVLFFNVNRIKKRNKLCRLSFRDIDIVSPTKTSLLHAHKFSTDRVKKTESTRKNDIPSVMILNRPGCELLESLLRDLAFVLRTHGIDVKLALLEQSQIDAEGGISSYLQRNIDTCDYVLIMFTDFDKERTSTKHRPYEFALKVISGLAYHENDSSRYIPLYLTNYDDAITLIPTFLVASLNFGFRIPKDLTKLIKKILKSKDLSNSKELPTKLNFFINRIKTTCKNIEARRHYSCNKEVCKKGTLFASVSNLSSVWASTAHSKWPSFHSINTSKDMMVLQTSEKENEIFFKTEKWNMEHQIVDLEGSVETEMICE